MFYCERHSELLCLLLPDQHLKSVHRYLYNVCSDSEIAVTALVTVFMAVVGGRRRPPGTDVASVVGGFYQVL